MTNDIAQNYRLSEASELFSQNIEENGQQLRSHLDDVRTRRDLSLRSLLAMQKNALEDSQAGIGLDPTIYWTKVAEPAAAIYRSESATVIDEGLLQVRDSITKLRQELRSFSNRTGRAQKPKLVSAWISEQLTPLRSVAPTSESINLVGEQWQKKLHRSAVARALPEILVRPSSSAENIISATEMKLLSQPPWVNGDRVLSAFELATVDIRTHLIDRLEELSGANRIAQDATQILILT